LVEKIGKNFGRKWRYDELKTLKFHVVGFI
jgi:hypothetical protein